jgi:hypothetical protein
MIDWKLVRSGKILKNVTSNRNYIYTDRKGRREQVLKPKLYKKAVRRNQKAKYKKSVAARSNTKIRQLVEGIGIKIPPLPKNWKRK